MSAMSLTADAIPCLCNVADPPPTGYCPVLQVLLVKKIKKNEEPGSFFYRVVLSDGTFYCDGSIALQLHHLVEQGVLETYSYIQIEKFTAIEVQKSVVLILLDLVELQNVKFPWGTPCRFTAPIDLQEGKRKSSDPRMVVRNHFFVRNTEQSKDDNDSTTCDTCNGKPCDWTKYGSDLVAFINEMCPFSVIFVFRPFLSTSYLSGISQCLCRCLYKAQLRFIVAKSFFGTFANVVLNNPAGRYRVWNFSIQVSSPSSPRIHE